MNEILIRKATLEDCQQLAKLKRTIWETTYRGIYPQVKFDTYSFEEQENLFRNLVDKLDVALFIVVLKESIIGYFSVGAPRYRYEDYEQEIGLLYLVKEYQGKGIGTKMFNYGYHLLKENGYKKFFISCNKYNNKAQVFYQKMKGVIVRIDDDHVDKSRSQIIFHYTIL